MGHCTCTAWIRGGNTTEAKPAVLGGITLQMLLHSKEMTKSFERDTLTNTMYFTGNNDDIEIIAS